MKNAQKIQNEALNGLRRPARAAKRSRESAVEGNGLKPLRGLTPEKCNNVAIIKHQKYHKKFGNNKNVTYLTCINKPGRKSHKNKKNEKISRTDKTRNLRQRVTRHEYMGFATVPNGTKQNTAH